MSLWNKTRNENLATALEVAKTFAARSKGLLGRQHLAADAGLWIHNCNSIHTWFMKFPIDVIFVDKQLKVRATYRHIAPWRLVWPVWRAQSVFEFAAGHLDRHAVQVGDELDVRA